jgi:hypothetical protein
LSGLDSDENRHSKWPSVQPSIGDELLIRIAENAAIVDSRRPCDFQPPTAEPDTVDGILEAIRDYEEGIRLIKARVEANRDRPVHRAAEVVRFDVSVDGVRRCVAGVPRDGVLTARVESIWRVGEEEPYLRLQVGGMDGEQRFYEWVTFEALPVPSVVRVAIRGRGRSTRRHVNRIARLPATTRLRFSAS